MANLVVTKKEQKDLNGMIGTLLSGEGQIGDLLAGRKVVIRGNYKFSRDGGLVSTINLKDVNGVAITLPAGLIVKDGLIVVKTALTSGGAATIGCGIGSGASVAVFKSAAALTTVDAANETSLVIPVAANAATAVVVGADGLFTISIGTAAITAGELDVFLDGYFRE